MAPRRISGGVLVVSSLTLLLGACGAEEDTDLVETRSAITTANALTANALTANALTANALTANALTANALTANALTANGLRDPLGRELLKYVVSCALPEGTVVSVTVDNHRYDFPGSIGLAPQWGGANGSCDGSCQRWVSGCVLARVDATGVERIISIRGDHSALRPTWHELRDFREREATYYGNIFAEGQPPTCACRRTRPRTCGCADRRCPAAR